MQSIKDTNYNGIVILAKNAAHQHMSTNVYEKMQVDGKTVYNQYSISGKEWVYITKDETKCITENEARTTLNGSYLDNVTINNLLGIGDKKGNHCENSYYFRLGKRGGHAPEFHFLAVLRQTSTGQWAILTTASGPNCFMRKAETLLLDIIRPHRRVTVAPLPPPLGVQTVLPMTKD